jgi:hypothetical protein
MSRLVHLSTVRRRRLLAVTGAVLVALAIWTIAKLVFGMEIRTPALDGIPEPTPIGAFEVIVVSALLSLAGWALLVFLERLTIRARKLWAVIAIVALVLSLATPLLGTGITAANRVVLLLIHLSVGGVLIPTLYWSTHRRVGDP